MEAKGDFSGPQHLNLIDMREIRSEMTLERTPTSVLTTLDELPRDDVVLKSMDVPAGVRFLAEHEDAPLSFKMKQLLAKWKGDAVHYFPIRRKEGGIDGDVFTDKLGSMILKREVVGNRTVETRTYVIDNTGEKRVVKTYLFPNTELAQEDQIFDGKGKKLEVRTLVKGGDGREDMISVQKFNDERQNYLPTETVNYRMVGNELKPFERTQVEYEIDTSSDAIESAAGGEVKYRNKTRITSTLDFDGNPKKSIKFTFEFDAYGRNYEPTKEYFGAQGEKITEDQYYQI
jgi:hypothetical protein